MRILLSFLFTLTVFSSHAVCVSMSSGNWGNPLTWMCNGSPSVPGCGDTIVINAGHTVNVSVQQDYSGCGSPMYIYIDGTLDFPNNGPKLKLPEGSYIQINSGG